MVVNVIDSIMGSGKTAAAINYINSADEKSKFIYITPYLSEVNRIISACSSKKFKEPKSYGSKITGLKELLNKGVNVATTHALFHLFDDEIIDLCYSQGYILIMDEVTNVIEPYEIDKHDAEILMEKFVTIDEDTGLIRWRNEQANYNGDKFIQEKKLCELNCLAFYGGTLMLWMFPVKIFKAFRKSYILTYMFNAQLQKYYYDYNGIEYHYLYVVGNSIETYEFSEEPNYSIKTWNYRNLITIIEDEKLNMIGDDMNALSKGWYKRNRENVLITKLKNNIYNFFKNKAKMYDEAKGKLVPSKTSNNLWTTFKDYEKLLSGKGYTKGFLQSNMRATNDYMNRSAVAYCVNKYFNPFIKKFFEQHNILVDEDGYAISEMLQFLWRSAIRQGKPIMVYIPSRRMRELLKRWIEANSSVSKADNIQLKTTAEVELDD